MTAVATIAIVPTYSMRGPFRGHLSLKSSPFSPGFSCKLSNQYLIQDHMSAHYKKIMSAKAAVDSSAPKSLHTSVKYNDQQKRDRLIQALQNYKKDHIHSLSASPFTSRSVSPSQQKGNRSLLEKNRFLQSGRINCFLTRKEQLPFIPCQKLPSRSLSPAFTARKTIQSPAWSALCPAHLHEASPDRSSASPPLRSRVHMSNCSRKKTVQNSFNKTYSGDLLDKHSVCFTEKKQHFTPRILKTPHQSILVKHRYYNPPHQKRNSRPRKPPPNSGDDDNEKKGDLRSFLEDALVRPHSHHFCEKPVENYELWFTNSDMTLSPRSQLQEKADYLCFLEDLTNDILNRSCYHKVALEDVFQMHIQSKRHNLDEVKMRRLVQSLKKELNITNHADLPISSKSP